MEQRLIYLDHNATAPVKPGVRDTLLESIDILGNPSAIHCAGRVVRKRIEDARSLIAQSLKTGEKDTIIFTSSATEANNQVLHGSGCTRILFCGFEHKSVLKAAPNAEIVPATPQGLIDLDALEDMLKAGREPTLISIMYVNNETGVIQPVYEVVDLAKKYGALVHTDAVQAVGKVQIDIGLLGVDYFTLSGHKLGGPLGAGALIVSNCAPIDPLLVGGGQEQNMRAGTYNMPGICGLAKSVELAVTCFIKMSELNGWRDRLERKLKKIAPNIRIYGEKVPRVPNTVMFSVPGLSAQTQMIGLDLAKICVSTGSACTSGSVKPSHVLKAMGVDDEEASSALRVSMGWTTQESDVDVFAKEWEKIYARAGQEAA